MRGKPETFTFLGFTHYCGTNTTGPFRGLAANGGEADEGKADAIKQELRRMMHEPVAHVGAWLKRVVEAITATTLCRGT